MKSTQEYHGAPCSARQKLTVKGQAEAVPPERRATYRARIEDEYAQAFGILRRYLAGLLAALDRLDEAPVP